MLRRMLCGATLIGGFFWGVYLIYGWWAFSSLIALGAMASIVRQGMIESLVSQTVMAVVLLGMGAALRAPKVIHRKVKGGGALRTAPARSAASVGSRDNLRGIEDYDPLVDGSAAGDTVRMALIRKYRIRRDDTLGLIICEGQAFRSLDEALEHARQAEIESKRQARAHQGAWSPETADAEASTLAAGLSGADAPAVSGETGRSSEASRAAAGALRELMRPGSLTDGSAPPGAAAAQGRAGQRSVVPAT